MRTIIVLIALSWATAASATMQITEYMYAGNLLGGVDGEFIEFTNVGGPAVDMAGWSFDDSTQTPGSTSLSAFGTVQPGESVILAQSAAADFKTAWGLGALVKVIGGNLNNLGRADEINLYNNASGLVDRLTYDDQGFAGTIRTQFKSGWTPVSNLGPTTINNQWVLSAVSDAQNSYAATTGDLGNPGTYIPEPATAVLAALSAMLLVRRKR